MKKITLYTRCEIKPEWHYLRNEIYVRGLDALPLEESQGVLAPIAGVMRALLKSGFTLAFAVIENVAANGAVLGDGEGYGTVFSSFDARGTRPLNGPLFYRDVARFNLYSEVGRPGHLWFRGMLDETDVLPTRTRVRGGVIVNDFAQVLRDAAASFNCGIFDNLAFIRGDALWPVVEPLLSVYTDSHSQTRWRRRLQGAVLDCGLTVLETLQLMIRAAETARYYQGVNVRIAPGSVWSDLKQALSTGVVVKQAIKSAMDAPKLTGGQNAPPPILRFGPTWVELLSRWDVAVEAGKKPLEDLLKHYPPHNEGGDTYIDTDYLQNYLDKLDEVLKKVCTTANSDWFNPQSYPGQIPAIARVKFPDIIELAF